MTTQIKSVPFSDSERQFLRAAADYLEHPSFLIKIANVLGKPAEAVLTALPERAQARVADVTTSALKGALEWAVRSLPEARIESRPAAPTPDGRSKVADHL